MNIFEAMDQALALVPLTYPKRSELEAEIGSFHAHVPEEEPTKADVLECFHYYIGTATTITWKKKIAEILEG